MALVFINVTNCFALLLSRRGIESVVMPATKSNALLLFRLPFSLPFSPLNINCSLNKNYLIFNQKLLCQIAFIEWKALSFIRLCQGNHSLTRKTVLPIHRLWTIPQRCEISNIELHHPRRPCFDMWNVWIIINLKRLGDARRKPLVKNEQNIQIFTMSDQSAINLTWNFQHNWMLWDRKNLALERGWESNGAKSFAKYIIWQYNYGKFDSRRRLFVFPLSLFNEFRIQMPAEHCWQK